MNRRKKILYLVYIIVGNLTIASCSSQLVPKGALTVSRGKPFYLELPSNLGRGYQWKLADTINYKVLNHEAKPNMDKSMATDTERFLLITSAKKGGHELVFYYWRPFEKQVDTASAEKFKKIIFIK